MKLTMFLAALALLMCLVQAQPVSVEPLDSIGELDPAEIESVGAPELKKAYAQLLRQEAQQEQGEEQSGDSLSRQKRAICRCYRRPRNRVLCICR